MGNHGAVSAGDRPRALLCWPFQHGARLSSLVLAFPAWCSGWVDLVRSLRLQIRSERRLLVFAPSVGVGESLRQLAALAARRACSVRRRTARESERRRRKNVENGVDWTVPVTSEECMPAYRYTYFVFGHAESGHCRDCSPGHWFPSTSVSYRPYRIHALAAFGFLRLLPPFLRCQTGLVHCIMVNSAAVPDGDAGAHQRQS